MSKQNQAAEPQQNKSTQAKDRLVPAPEQAGGQAVITGLPGSLMATGDDPSLQAQVARLDDHRFLPAQRQAMTARMGRMGGNHYLQRVMVQRKTSGPGQPGTEPLSDEVQEQPDSHLAQSSHREPAAQRLPLEVSQATGLELGPRLQKKPNKKQTQALSSKLPLVQVNASLVNANYTLADAYVNLAVANTDLLSTKLQIFSLNYDMAYSRYANIIGQGRAEAQNQTLWRGIFLGIATGVVAGLAAAYIAPSTAAGWFALTLADAGTAAGSSFLQAAFSSAVALAVSDAITTRGSDLQPGGLSPDVLKTSIWQHVSAMYRGAFETNKVLANLHKNSVVLERLSAEMRVHIAGGASDYSPEDILKAADIMNERINGMKPVFDELRKKSTSIGTISKSISSYDPTKPGVDQMEKDIWIMWMGTLSDDDSDILDLDAIEDHLAKIGILGSGGTLGVDFGDYTSEDDELAALAAARPKATALKDQYDKTASQWNAPDTK